jgi:type I restriction enzyme R subunit
MAAVYTEDQFESFIEAQLLHSNYNKAEPALYNKDLCLLEPELIKFIKATQPKPYEKLQGQYGSQTDQKLSQRLHQVISKSGTLYVLRNGFEDRGSKFQLVYFKPSSGMNPDHQRLYEANQFTVVRQVRYSKVNENSIDLVIFLNGIPIITLELKNALTGQTNYHAEKQYKQDRDSKEPLLQYKRCLVHFAIGTERVSMTTRLSGHKTRFFPFNQDTINPPNPNGFSVSYLWEDILQPDTLLDLLSNYIQEQEFEERDWDAKKNDFVTKKSSALIFPRYHQLDVVRKLLKQSKEDGAGKSYLIQHSAGSGKSNSISWLVHQLANLYQNAETNERLFDSIIVVTDRRILDRQLQNNILQFQQTEGVVQAITDDSKQLKAALETGKNIIISTIQKFPVIAESMAFLKGKRFAVVIDEAHSSSSGETATQLTKTLSIGLEEAEKEDEEAKEQLSPLEQIAKLRGKQEHISYFAFTATPKAKTIELFGTKKTPESLPEPFHTYTMRQAIEEGFIKDVLANYTTFKRYFKLLQTKGDDFEVPKSKATRLLTSYVDLQPHAIEKKVEIILEHFLKVTVNAIEGKGRAMVVTKSRLHALKYYLVFRRLMKEMNLPFKPLVAFSGSVRDPDTNEDYTESVNGLPPRVKIEDALKTPEYRILIVANKYQTGFDEPMLHTMYVDRKLGGVQAVQTLSRLNRTMSGKTDTCVLDFANDADDILTPFQTYYQKTILENETDPNKLYDSKTELEVANIYRQSDVDEFIEVLFDESKDDSLLQPILDRCVGEWRKRTDEEKELFRSNLQSYIRLYGFLSQIVSFQDANLEALYIFAKALNKKLDKREGQGLPTEILEEVDLDSYKIQKTYQGQIELHEEDGEVKGIQDGTGIPKEELLEMLSSIIQTLNDTFGIDLTDDDKVDLERIKEKIQQDNALKAFMKADNTHESKKKKFEETFDSEVLDLVHTRLELVEKLKKEDVDALIKRLWFDSYMKEMSITASN